MYFTPVYSEFHDSVVNSGRTPLTVSLKEQDGYYEIDYEAFEEAAKRRPGLLIMCNPHNPVGRSWTREELEKVGDICVRYQIPIISEDVYKRQDWKIPVYEMWDRINEQSMNMLKDYLH